MNVHTPILPEIPRFELGDKCTSLPPIPPPSKTLCPGCSNSDSTIQWINYHPLSCLTVIAMFESATNCTETVTESELQITVLIERNLITKMAMYMDRGKE